MEKIANNKITTLQFNNGSHVLIKQYQRGVYVNKFITVNDFIKSLDSLKSNNKDKHYTHNQPNPASSWLINHNLNKFPTICVTDTAGNEVEGDIIQIDLNNITIIFSASFAGKAHLN